MLAVITVTNFGDVGAGSLRDAITVANASVGVADTIDFAAALNGGTINLTSGELPVIDAVTIDASSLAAGITLDAGDGTDNSFNTGDGFRIFNINDGDAFSEIAVTLRGLTLTGADANGSGGAISSLENLTFENSTLLGNAATGGGGGV